MRRTPRSPAVQRLIDTVASEAWPYTDPAADYPRAKEYRRDRANGAARRS